ncbi:unnamed protein product [Camellia sinensis]
MADRKPQNNGFSSETQTSIPALDPPQKPKRNNYAFACAIFASMTSILLGYDIGVMSGAGPFIKKDLKISDVQLEILMGISLFGCVTAGTIVLASAIFFVGAILMGFATSYAFLMVGRLVVGIGVGYALMIAPVYTAEVSPAASRGFLVSLPEVFINAGILLAFVSNYAFSKLPLHLGWRFMLGVGAIPSAFLALGGDAKRVLDKTSDSKEEAQLRLDDIKEAVGIPEECNDDVVQVSKRSYGKDVWKELFLHPTPTVRHVLLAVVGIHFFQQTSGIDAVMLYSPKIFEKAGVTNENFKLLAMVAVGFVKTLFILVATFLIDRIGRRALLFNSVAGMVVSLATLGVSLTIIDHSDKKSPDSRPSYPATLFGSPQNDFVLEFFFFFSFWLSLSLRTEKPEGRGEGEEGGRRREEEGKEGAISSGGGGGGGGAGAGGGADGGAAAATSWIGIRSDGCDGRREKVITKKKKRKETKKKKKSQNDVVLGGYRVGLPGRTAEDPDSDKKLIWAVALAITSVLAYVATFSIGMGPITWVYSSEIFPLRLRAQGICVGVAVNRVLSGTLSMTFLSLYKAITIGGAFFLFMGVAMVGWVFFYTLLPETQGKTLEEMQVLFGTFFRWRSTMRELEKNNNAVNSTGDGNDNKGISNGQIQMGTTNC